MRDRTIGTALHTSILLKPRWHSISGIELCVCAHAIQRYQTIRRSHSLKCLYIYWNLLIETRKYKSIATYLVRFIVSFVILRLAFIITIENCTVKFEEKFNSNLCLVYHFTLKFKFVVYDRNQTRKEKQIGAKKLWPTI